jgi:hypothetical protein
MSNKDVLEQLATCFELQKLIDYYKSASSKFRPQNTDVSEVLSTINDPRFEAITQIGEIEYDNASRLGFFVCPLTKDLTEKTSKKIQYDIGKKLLKVNFYDAGIFVFYGANKSFRLSLIAASYLGPKREFTTFRRYTYFVSPELTNKTFIKQLSRCDFSSIEKILQAFSIEAVSEEFYNSFKPKFDEIASSIKDGKIDNQTRQDFALLFAIRIIFLGFVEKRGWLGGNEKFIQSFWAEYNQHKQKSKCSDEFYTRWLEPLFFEALNSEPGKKVEWGNNDFSEETEKILQMAPFLNGELFKRKQGKQGVDDKGFYLPDKVIGEFLDFLFQYNFTIDENTAYDEELELNPEFLGIIFERFVNQELGAIYTPRTEVDLMCRLSLLRWLERKNEFDAKELHYLFFRTGGKGAEFEEDQKEGNFSEKEIRKLLEFLENVTICDPAAGSGAFEVGMLQVINETIEKLYKMPHFPEDVEKKEGYERKKSIIAKSLYGVEVQGYAVWINQLRLWLTLFIDMPDEMKSSLKPLLPCLNFKVRRGDSLIQRIGNKMFPVQGDTDLPKAIREKIDDLKKEKNDFYYNRGKDEKFIHQLETQVFKKIVDGQIASRQKKLDSIAKPQKQLGLGFGKSEVEQKHLLELVNYEKNRNELTAEIEELRAEYQNLTEEHPLIWSIEFSEIFYDKGGFDIIIGNPPYVNQLEIADPEGKVEPKEYKKLLYQMADLDYPRHFNDRKINGQSDLYTFFYLRSLHLLNKGGVHCFICSNSWLDVGYGVWMQEFLLENVPVYLIIDNHARRSFSTVDINTIITLFDAPDKNYNKHSQLVKFVAFRKPFEECIFTENLWQLHQTEYIFKNDICRIYPITAEELYDEGWEADEESKSKHAGEYVGDKWGGKYLRAPDIFFTILQKGKSKLAKLKDIAKVRRGITAGSNKFFYLTGEQVKQWEIESEFIRPVIKSPQECLKINIGQDDLSLFLFLCKKTKSELKGTHALKYIDYGEKAKVIVKQGNSKGKIVIGFNNLETLKARKKWYDIGLHSFSNHVWQKAVNDRHIQSSISFEAFVDQRLYEIICSTKIMEMSCILNSSVTFLIKELIGRVNLGAGALDTTVYEAKRLLLLNPELITVKKKLPIFDRNAKSIYEECGIDPKSKIPIEEQEPKPLPDRKELDDIVFDALGLTEDERKDVYRAVCRLVWNRLSKAKSV